MVYRHRMSRSYVSLFSYFCHAESDKQSKVGVGCCVSMCVTVWLWECLGVFMCSWPVYRYLRYVSALEWHPFDCMYVGVKKCDPSVGTIPVNKNLCQMWQPCPFPNKILINWQGILALTDYNYEKFMNFKSNNIPRCWSKFTWETY